MKKAFTLLLATAVILFALTAYGDDNTRQPNGTEGASGGTVNLQPSANNSADGSKQGGNPNKGEVSKMRVKISALGKEVIAVLEDNAATRALVVRKKVCKPLWVGLSYNNPNLRRFLSCQKEHLKLPLAATS